MAGSITIIVGSCHAGPGSIEHRPCVRLSTRRVLRPSVIAVPVIGLWGRLAFANLPPREVQDGQTVSPNVVDVPLALNIRAFNLGVALRTGIGGMVKRMRV